MLYVLLLCGAIPHEIVVEDTVDLIEINYSYDKQTKGFVGQAIFWYWYPKDNSYRVAAWRHLTSSSQIPHRDRRQGYYITAWHDGDRLRKVKAPLFRETWTICDPEQIDREFLPINQRLRLTHPKAKFYAR